MGIRDTLADAASDLRGTMGFWTAVDGDDYTRSRAMAMYVFMIAMQNSGGIGVPNDTELAALLAGDTSYFDDPAFAALSMGREGVPLAPDLRETLVSWYTAVAQALNILDEQVVPLLTGPLRPLTPPGETAVDRVIDKYRRPAD